MNKLKAKVLKLFQPNLRKNDKSVETINQQIFLAGEYQVQAQLLTAKIISVCAT